MLAAIRTRLAATLPEGRWAGVIIVEDIDLLAEQAGQVADSTLIVMPWRERAEAQALASGGHRQRVETQFAAGIVLREYDDMGETRALRFDTLKGDLEGALAGWTPEGACAACELVGGESSPVVKGVSIYVQTWATARFLTGEIS